ncbi:MAG: hypothetical protein R3E82_23140 [Pseudomonadales bacterium]|nr:hypothetical protein [Pseudomonadales bacterium]
MIYLIMKIFLYLLLAMAAGGGAGWLLRNLSAMKREEALNRALSEARARVPQFEAQLRAREDQGKRTRDEMATKERVIAELMEEIKAKEDTLRERDLQLKKLATVRLPDNDAELAQPPLPPRAVDDLTAGDILPADNLDYAAVSDPSETLPSPADPAEQGESRETVQRLRERISTLEQALHEARTTAADAVAEAAAAEAEVVNLKAELAKVSVRHSAGVDRAANTAQAASVNTSDLEARLRQKAEDFERLSRNLETEKRKVTELERERELQNKSLQVLHQQLELERERGARAASG